LIIFIAGLPETGQAIPKIIIINGEPSVLSTLLRFILIFHLFSL